MSTDDRRPPFTESEAAEYVGSTPRHLRALRFAGEIPYIKLGPKLVRYMPDDLDAWLDTRRQSRRSEVVA